MLRRWRNTLAFPVLFLVAAALLAQGTEAGKAKATHKGSAKKAVVWPAADLKWEPTAGSGISAASRSHPRSLRFGPRFPLQASRPLSNAGRLTGR
jgi:hypothetical protein